MDICSLEMESAGRFLGRAGRALGETREGFKGTRPRHLFKATIPWVLPGYNTHGGNGGKESLCLWLWQCMPVILSLLGGRGKRTARMNSVWAT